MMADLRWFVLWSLLGGQVVDLSRENVLILWNFLEEKILAGTVKGESNSTLYITYFYMFAKTIKPKPKSPLQLIIR